MLFLTEYMCLTTEQGRGGGVEVESRSRDPTETFLEEEESIDGLANSVGQNDIVEKATRHNEAMKRAPIKLYDVYISLYINNNTQEALAFDWDVCCEYIRKLNKSLCEFLQKQLT